MKGFFKKPSLYILAAVISALFAVVNLPIMDKENYEICMMSKQRIVRQIATGVDFSNSRLYNQVVQEFVTEMVLLGFACSAGLHLAATGVCVINQGLNRIVGRFEKSRAD